MLWTAIVYSVYTVNNFTTALVFLFVFLATYLHTRRQYGIPPGPPLMPIIGNMHIVASSDLLGTLDKLRKIYGDVFGLYFGGKLVVFLSGYETIHEAFMKKGSVFKHRPTSPLYGNDGIVVSNGMMWREHRKIVSKALNSLYSNEDLISDIMETEIEELLDILGSFSDAEDIDRFISWSVANVVLRFLVNHRCKIDDPDLLHLQAIIRAAAKEFLIHEAVYNCFPCLAYLPASFRNSRKIQLSKAFKAIITQRDQEKDGYKSETPACFSSFYNRQMEQNKLNEMDSTLSEDEMHMAGYQMVSAGSDSTTSTIMWIILYLIRNPDIQEKMVKEMHDIVGDESVQLKHRCDLPYVHAVYLEGLRMGHIVPLGIPHTVHRDIYFRGYLIPKECTVLANLASSLYDPLVWPEPEVFRPERFLGNDGKEVIIPPQFIPFSLGPRACVGETFARMELFLVVANIVKTFRLRPEVDGVYPPTSGTLGVTYHPLPYKMRLIKR